MEKKGFTRTANLRSLREHTATLSSLKRDEKFWQDAVGLPSPSRTVVRQVRLVNLGTEAS